MDVNIQTSGGHRTDYSSTIPQVDGAGDSRKGKKRGTPKKGSSANNGSAPTTPSRRGRGGDHGRGRGAKNATSPSAPGVAFTTTLTNVTDVREVYTSLPGAAFTTLRWEGSQAFKAFLQQLEEPSRQSELRPVGFTAPSIAAPFTTASFIADPTIAEPSITGPDIARSSTRGPGRPSFSVAGLSIVLEQLRETSSVHAEPSPSDSGVDVLTPDLAVTQFASGVEKSAQGIGNMAPVREVTQAERDRLREQNQHVEVVSDAIKDVLQDYYELQTQVHGYRSEAETRDVLINKIRELSQSLARVERESSSSTMVRTFVPPEVVDYVDDGRNSDIYTRDLVEVVQRGNAVLNGKMNAFGTFSKIFADDLRKHFPELTGAVNEIMDERELEVQVKQENGDTTSRQS